MLKRFFARYSWFLLIVLLACSQDEVISVPAPPEEISLSTSFYYEIDLNDRSDDTFKVRLYVDDLTEANNIFQFPATVPGTYSVLNFGRFVKTFKAYNRNYEEISTAKVGTNENQWIITNPEEAYIIEYTISETFDTPVDTDPIYLMAGTSIENDHVLLNTFGALGYVTGLDDRNYYLKLYYPSNWSVGTSLELKEEGYYYAQNYDYLVDSPVILGKVTSAFTKVTNTNVNVFSYAKNNQISSTQILSDINQVLIDAEKFLKVLPVDRYSFIYYFDDKLAGALEHSFSSVYVLKEQSYSANYGQFLKNIAAHEFFHVVTPLNIHSEVIEDFNFVVPTPSKHLWLYEGVTEWASYMMQYRNGSISAATVIDVLRGKIASARNSKYTYSLTDVSLTSYTPEGQYQYYNVYLRGALVATLMDILMLEINPQYGLRELLLDLIKTYGKENSFSEKDFFSVITSMTDPKVGEFITRYIEGSEELPLADYLAKIGLIYNVNINGVVELSRSINVSQEQQALFEIWSENL